LWQLIYRKIPFEFALQRLSSPPFFFWGMQQTIISPHSLSLYFGELEEENDLCTTLATTFADRLRPIMPTEIFKETATVQQIFHAY